jgi:inhibitor of KinA
LDAVFLCGIEKAYLNPVNAPRIYRLSECAMTMEVGQAIDPEINRQVIELYHGFRRDPFPGFLEAVPAYASLTVYFDPQATRLAFPGKTAAETVARIMRQRYAPLSAVVVEEDPVVFQVPVCYDPSFGTDLAWVADYCGLSTEALIDRHCSVLYRVYMIGFVPGFPYLGITDPSIEVPRKARPALSVPRGSVALAGRQTGIYPADIPGGWQVIGRTPLALFDPVAEPCSLLRAGMKVQFRPISPVEFAQMEEHGTAHT